MNRMILTLIMMLLCASTAYSKVTYLHSNPMGSVVAATDETGKQIWVKRYTPYGIESEAGGTVNDSGANYGFATHELDKETGLVYMKARYYDPVVGKFYSTDPIGLVATSIRTFNSYMYAENSPYVFVDPNGKEVAYFGVNINLLGLGIEMGGFVTFPGLFSDPYDLGLYASPVISQPIWLDALLPGPDPVMQGSYFGESGYMHNTSSGFFDFSNIYKGFRTGNLTLSAGGVTTRSSFDGYGVETCGQYGVWGGCGAYNYEWRRDGYDIFSGAKGMYGPQLGVSTSVTYTGSYSAGDVWNAWSGYIEDTFSSGDWYSGDGGLGL